MTFCEDCGDVEFYDYGDRVRLVQNHMLTGQVIGERNWGQEYQVRIGATVTALWFERVELEPDPDFSDPAMVATPPVSGDGAAPDNVINLAARRTMGGMQ